MGRTGRVIVIVGASRGIGRACALEFAHRGCRLVLFARDAAALEETATQCRAQGAEVVTMAGDATRPGALAELVDRALARFGRIDVWVGVAGVLAYGGVEEMPTDVFRRILETNLVAHVDGVKAALPVFRAQSSGRIVLVGSLYSRVSAPSMSAYVASKFALLGFTRSLRQELLGSRGIDVRIVLPATIDTPIYQRAINVTGRTPHPMPPITSPYRVARAIERSSHGRGPHAVRVGTLQSTMILLSAGAPRLYDRIIRILISALGLRRRPARDSLGALEDPRTGPDGVTGQWRRPVVRAGLAGATLATAAAVANVLRRRRPS